MKRLILFLFCMLPIIAAASLSEVGPSSKKHGFPLWYKDSNGLKLSLCLDMNSHCLPLDGLNMRRPIKFPSNFPNEAFWWAAETEVKSSEGGSVSLTLALEAAFSTRTGAPRSGKRISFARVRIKGTDLPIGSYRITHPYGQEVINVWSTEDAKVNVTKDVGIADEIFTGALDGSVGPFLSWDPAVPPLAPEGFIGDPTVPHKVIGSPTGKNFLRVERIDLPRPREIGFTDEFNVAGKIRP